VGMYHDALQSGLKAFGFDRGVTVQGGLPIPITTPAHGTAFDIAGKQIANPSSFILSTKMMLDWLGSKHNDSECISAGKKLETVVLDLIKSGITTKDIGGEKSTQEFTKEITSRL
ncbi:MAG: isocitrate/isopropylmalate family dehydrogenase, partial [Thermoproteota archaeon]|nr:isocitrate/isopropylmalate family dehydrogenase [Thermoproteota archaeon]